MVYLVVYSFLVLLMFLFALGLFIYTLFSVVAHLAGSPYVPTKQKEVEFILQKAGLRKNQVFVELGSGDGRVVRTAVSRYGVRGVGIEIHPLLLLYSKLLARVQKLKTVSFKQENFFKTNLTKAQVVFLFLMPNTLKKLAGKLTAECPNKTLVISHGFALPGWEKYLRQTIAHVPFPTYFYLINA